MSSQPKRKSSLELVANPFVKKRNLAWRVGLPSQIRDDERRRAREVTGEGPVELRRHGTVDMEREEEKGSSGADKRLVSSAPSLLPPTTTTNTATATSSSSNVLSTPTPVNQFTQLPADDQQHLTHFTHLLQSHTRPPLLPPIPLLPLSRYTALYRHNARSPQGAHFVVTQHDHPVAGPHYDLRLQINQTSSCSWAIMYGLPGDPNARGKSGGRGNGAGCVRGAVETRVHCLWNHLVEMGGQEAGSLLIWDVGEYEVLRPESRGRGSSLSGSGGEEDDEDKDGDGANDEGWNGLTQQEKLARAFSGRKIRVRLKGWRLPRVYVINLRLPRKEDTMGRARAAAKAAAGGGGREWRRARRGMRRGPPVPQSTGPDTSSSGEDSGGEGGHNNGSKDQTTAAAEGPTAEEEETRELEGEEERRTNAYSGACNTIGSVHQRRWFLTLDREACGFVRVRRESLWWWEQKRQAEDDEMSARDEAEEHRRLTWPFYVRGPEQERSIVTGRLGSEVLRDEGVVGFVGRKGWRPILH